MTREASSTDPVGDEALGGLTPPAKSVEVGAERHADVAMLRTALSDLAEDDRQILLDRHVHDKAVTTIATGLGVRPRAVTMLLRRAEERLAGAFAALHARGVDEPECRTARTAMHDYLKGRLLPPRQRRLEVHMDGCGECTRVFLDVREVSWMLRDLGQHLFGDGWVTGDGSAGRRPEKPRSFSKPETAVAAGVLAVLAIGGAAAFITDRPDQAPVGAPEDGGTGRADGSGGNEGSVPSSEKPTTRGNPPSLPPADPRPRPVTTPKEDRAAPPADQPPAAAEPAPAPATDTDEVLEPAPTDSGPDTARAQARYDGTDEPEPAHPASPPAEPDDVPADLPHQAAVPAQPTPGHSASATSSPPGDEPGGDPPGTENSDSGHAPGNGNEPGDDKGQEPGDNNSPGLDLRDQLTSWLADLGLAGAPSR